MSNQPILSICIPTYNGCQRLRLALSALIPQIVAVGKRVELIVSDNCSTDATRQVVEEMQGIGPIRYSRNETNIGANPNFLLLVSTLARGKYVWLLGDDDIVRPDGVEMVLRVLEANPDAPYVFVNYTRWSVTETPRFPLLADDLPGLSPAGNSDFETRFLPKLSEIVSGDFNCFTPIYVSIFRLSDAKKAYSVDPKTPAFSSLASVSPQALFIAGHLLDKPAWYIGYPCVITLSSQSWKEYQPIYVLHLLPQLYDVFQKSGIPGAIMDTHRRLLLSMSQTALTQALTSDDVPYWNTWLFWRLFWKNRRFREMWGLFILVYLPIKMPLIYGTLRVILPVKMLWKLWQRLKKQKS